MKLKSKKNLTFLVFLGTFIFYLPFLGSYGLFDPWETHYSEVARSMIQRDDYISTFWQDNGFYSKPVLTFWLQAAGMKAAGLNKPGSPPDEMAMTSKPEWAVRTPVALLASMAVASLFFLVLVFFGLRTALFSAIILAATPFFALIARQTITDMPFVSFITMGMVCLIYGFLHNKPPDTEEVSLIRRRKVNYIVYGIIFLLTFLQYLLYAPNVDASFVLSGKRIRFAGWWVFLPYVLIIGDVIVSSVFSKITKEKAVILLGFAFIALGILAKGFGALFIPFAVFLLYFLITGEWEKIRRFNILHALFVVIAISFPWHHAMIIRHGGAFFQEYIIHHHFKRAALGVHGERGYFIYYINQLLIGLLPFLVLIPGSIGANISFASNGKPTQKKRFITLILLWAAVSFFLFSFMLTKFHHYILPLTVPLAILAGIFLNTLYEKKLYPYRWYLIFGTLIFIFAARELFLDPAHLINLFIYKYERLFPYELGFNIPIGIISGLIILSLLSVFIIKKRYSIFFYLFFSVVLSGWIIYSYIPKVAPGWSQKSLHKIYFNCRYDPSERFIAWQLNWRGENFYSKNMILPYMSTNNKEFIQYLMNYRSKSSKTPLKSRYLIMVSEKRFKRLKSLLNEKLYQKYSNIYNGHNSDDLISIVGPGCKTIKPEWIPHFRQKNFKILKESYPHNKFMLVRIQI